MSAAAKSLHLLETEERGVPHRYLVDKKRKHTWTSQWLPVVVELLFTGENEPAGN